MQEDAIIQLLRINIPVKVIELVVLGIWIGEHESVKFWLSAFNDLKSRGVKDTLIICSDRLTGMKEAITTAFPKSVQQRCIVHMIRNSVRFVSYKELKPFCEDLKTIYTSKNEKAGYEQLQKIKEKWKSKHPTALKSWEENWDLILGELSIMFEGRI